MPPLWDNQLVVDITIPSNGALTPGSGTVYIGGPQLVNIPGLNVPQYKSAIVWFSDAVGLAQGIDYWFMAHFSDTTFDGVRQGYYPTGGPTTQSSIAQYIVGGVHNSILESPQGNSYLKAQGLIQIESQGAATNFQAHATNNIFLDADFDVVLGSLSAPGRNSFLQAVNQLQLQTTNSDIFILPASGVVDCRVSNVSGTEYFQIDNLGVAPVIKAVSSSTIDKWVDTSVANVNINGVLATVSWSYYLTPDRQCEFRFFMRTNAGTFPAVPYLTIPLSGLTPPAPVTRTAPVEGPYGAGQANSIPVSFRIDSPTTMYCFYNSIATSNFLSGTIHYQVAKP